MSKSTHILHYLHTHRNWLFLLLTLGLLVLAFLNFNHVEAPVQTDAGPHDTIAISLTIADSYTNDTLTLPAGSTVLDSLIALDELENEMLLKTEHYEGLGDLVVSMYGLENGTGNRYWQYEAEGVMPQIGAGAYELKDDENIIWKFTESTY